MKRTTLKSLMVTKVSSRLRESGFASGLPSSEGTLSGQRAAGSSLKLQAGQVPQPHMVDVVQLVEHWIVVPGVAGSSPVIHPIRS